ncbi:MAG: penicillin acylase family protein [Myxococcales bacterium]|nr:penicillin acylase family protein [Myxococcales bacterium]
MLLELLQKARHLIGRGGGLRPGKLSLSALRAPVEVRLDDAEVPYIYATSVEDLLVAQGYVHASHRLAQMEMMRRFARGALSELLGVKPLRWQDTSLHFDGLSTVDLDALLRAFELEEAAKLSLAQVSPEYRRLVGCYVAGVNEYIARGRKRRELELLLLGGDVAPWTELDPFLLYKAFSYHLCFIWTAKLTLDAMLGRFPERADAIRRLVHGAARVPDAAFRAEHVVSELAALARGAVGFSGFAAGAYGSNCWAVSGERTASAMPLLACDPHLPLMAPSLTYFAHLEAPGLKVAGIASPGIPGVTIGHNDDYAWGLTHAWLDDCDVFRESSNGHAPSDAWETRTLEIPVKGERAPRRVPLRFGPRGPMISDLVARGRGGFGDSKRQSGIDPLELPAFSLRWTGRDGGRDLEAYWNVARGNSWGDFREACALFATPAWNMVYADRRGHIGYQLAGWVPNRPWGGSLDVVDVASTHDSSWRGYLPPSELMHAFDPPEGLIASANDRIADDSYPHYLSDLFEPPYRARRARELLAARDDHTVASMRAAQLDLYSAWADEINRDALQPLATVVSDERARRALALLAGWDGRFERGAGGPALFYAFVVRYARAVLERDLGRDVAEHVLELYSMPALTVQKMLQLRADAWLEDREPAAFIADAEAALAGAWSELCETLGDDASRWRWGALHQRTQRHLLHVVPLLRRLLSVGFVESGGDGTTLDSGILRFNVGYEQFGGSDSRLIVDLAQPDNSRWVLATGQSGDPISPHYRDQFALLHAGRDRPWPFSRAAVERATKRVVTLEPEG